MNLGSLVTIYNQNPENLVLVVLDNECYGSTGSQCTYSSTTDLKKVAEAIGFQKTFFFADEIEFQKVLETKGPVFVHVKVLPGNADVPVIPMEPEDIKKRFMEEVQGKK
jgi:sulfopyruvate decarboxylase subunit beta